MTTRAMVAVAPNGAIGKGGAVPWHYPEDMRHFREATWGHAIVMGRKTFESIGRPLAGRVNVVLSRGDFQHPGVEVVHDPDQLDAVVENLDPGQDVYIVGGAEIYALLADRVQEWVITRVPDRVEDADAFLDPGLLGGFSLDRRESLGGRGLQVEYWKRD
jgi:dihydrofolate reductase